VDLNNLQQIAEGLLNRIDFGWTFLLLSVRYLVFFLLVPGIGGGFMGLALRYPATLVMALVSVRVDNLALVPNHAGDMVVQMVAEAILGACIGMVPLLVVAGAQIAGHLASGTMGLNGQQLFDPTTQANLPDLARIYSDIAVMIFLMVGGHYVMISELSGVNANFRPGMFLLTEQGLEAILLQSGRLLQSGCLIAAPVIVALLLTNFVMALISKAVPSLNIFVISFPITIGVGFAISILAIPEVGYLLQREFNALPDVVTRITR
jgi:flagellar biosynthetic protein FliR